jgi:hypothetical protein
MKHTKGPWLIESKVYVCGGECCVAVTETYSAMQKLSPEQREANARLIAAAPELLEALKESLVILEASYLDWAETSNEFQNSNEDIIFEVKERVKEVIAKATGEQP